MIGVGGGPKWSKVEQLESWHGNIPGSGLFVLWFFYETLGVRTAEGGDLYGVAK